MFSLLEKLRTKRLERWKGTREKGKAHFIPGFALYFSLAVTGSYTIVSLIFEEPVNIFGVTVRLILNFFAGLLVGWFVWRSNERAFLANAAAYYPWGEEQAKDPEKFDAEWRRDWESMPHREVVDLTSVNSIRENLGGADFGKIVAATIASTPEKYISETCFHDENCPLCLQSTISTNRLAGSLYPTFEKIDNLGFGVWVHKKCFESLPLRDEQPGVPW